MEPGPLPPHERTWRHPSELAAATRAEIRSERPSGVVRAAALVGGTTTAVLMGLLVLSITPERTNGPSVAGSVPIQGIGGPAGAGDEPSRDETAGARAPGEPPAGVIEEVRPADATPPGAEPGGTATGDPFPATPIATLVGADGTAVVPSAAILASLRRTLESTGTTPAAMRSGVMIDRISQARPATGPISPRVDVTLADGSTVAARVVDAGDGTGLALVKVTAVAEAHPSVPTHRPSAASPPPDGLVLVLTDAPLPVRLDELLEILSDGEPAGTDAADTDAADLPYPDGTPVLDPDGQLVGVLACDDGGRMEFVAVPDHIARPEVGDEFNPAADATATPSRPDR